MPVTRFATKLTGTAGDDSVDQIDGAELSVDDVTICPCVDDDTFYAFKVDESGDTEGPGVIAPNTNAGNKRHKLLPAVSSNDNILINQDFAIWQENTTFTNPATTVYTADGYAVESLAGGGTLPTVNVKKNAVNMDTAFAQCCELEITNVGAAGATRTYGLKHCVEDFEKYKGKTLTVSIKIKASVAITLSGGKLYIYDGVGSGNVAITAVTTGYVIYSANITVDDAATELSVMFYAVAGTSKTISATGSIYIQWMKLEIGSVATPLVPRKTADELRLCQRYYQKSYAQGTFAGAARTVGEIILRMEGIASADHTAYLDTRFFVVMKSTPTITLYDEAGTSGKVTMAAGNGIAGTSGNACDSGFRASGTNGAASTTRKLAYHYTAISRI